MARLDDRGDKVRILDNEDGELFSVDDDGDAVVTGTLTVDGASTLTGAQTFTGAATFSDDITIADAQNVILKATTGTKIGTATTQKLGFFNATPVDQPAAYTQTYSTADRTHSAATATSVATTASTGTTPKGYTTVAQADAIVTAVNALIVDLRDTKQLVNSVIDDLQELGLAG